MTLSHCLTVSRNEIESLTAENKNLHPFWRRSSMHGSGSGRRRIFSATHQLILCNWLDIIITATAHQLRAPVVVDTKIFPPNSSLLRWFCHSREPLNFYSRSFLWYSFRVSNIYYLKKWNPTEWFTERANSIHNSLKTAEEFFLIPLVVAQQAHSTLLLNGRLAGRS